jgi:4-hydroxy-3-polyprenylbenzoate decarboxylase
VSCDLEVPWDAEMVIEGYIDPREDLVVEGPFGDHTGFYSEADLYPRGARHGRDDAPQRDVRDDDRGAGRRWRTSTSATRPERIFLPLLKLTIPEVVDYHMPAEGGFHNLVFVSIDKQYPGRRTR